MQFVEWNRSRNKTRNWNWNRNLSRDISGENRGEEREVVGCVGDGGDGEGERGRAGKQDDFSGWEIQLTPVINIAVRLASVCL